MSGDDFDAMFQGNNNRQEKKEDEAEEDDQWGASGAARLRNQEQGAMNEGGGGGDEAECIQGQWETFDLEHEDLTGIVDEASNEPECCFLCEIFQSESEMENNQRLKQFQLMLQNSYLLMSRRALGLEAREVYNKFLRPYTKFKRPFHARLIIEHIERHEPTPRITLESAYRTINNCLMDLRSNIHEREVGTKRTRLNHKNIAQYMKLLASQNELIIKLDRIKENK